MDTTTMNTLLDLGRQIAAMNENVSKILDKLSMHEMRISQIEVKVKSEGVNQFLSKGIVIALAIIASLTGASNLIAGLLK